MGTDVILFYHVLLTYKDKTLLKLTFLVNQY